MNVEISNIGSALLEKEKRKSFSIRVFPDQKVLIKVPEEAQQEEIEHFIKRKRKWLIKQLNFFQRFQQKNGYSIQSGMEILYLGKKYQLIIQRLSIKNSVIIEKNKIIVCCGDDKYIEKILADWSKQQSDKIFLERFRHCLKQFPNIEVPTLKIRKLNKRWGSYLKGNVVALNPLLIKASKKEIDFVIIHELCHYFYKNHNEQFYNLMTAVLPNWKKIQEDLEETVWGK